MKSSFSTYYKPDDNQFKALWDNCIFVFDANVLLNLYRYTQSTTERFISIIQRVSERVWLPHQVVLEYHSNRLGVIQEQINAYDDVIRIMTSEFNSFINNINNELKSYKKRHPIIDVETIDLKFTELSREIHEELKKQQDLHPDYMNNDNIRDQLEEIFENKIGSPFSQEDLNDIYREGEVRYKLKRPPGYKDAQSKKDKLKFYSNLMIQDQFGDLIVWRQIINHSISVNRPIIFITDDAKEDWWQRQYGKTIGPRIELIDEFNYLTKKNFYMYESYRFMEYAQNFLNQQVDNVAINEILQVKLHKEPVMNESILNELIRYNKLKEIGQLQFYINKPIVSYTVGEKVLHSKWGVGYVEQVKGSGKEQEISVYFMDVGLKRLLSYFAPLTKVDEIDDSKLANLDEDVEFYNKIVRELLGKEELEGKEI